MNLLEDLIIGEPVLFNKLVTYPVTVYPFKDCSANTYKLYYSENGESTCYKSGIRDSKYSFDNMTQKNDLEETTHWDYTSNVFLNNTVVYLRERFSHVPDPDHVRDANEPFLIEFELDTKPDPTVDKHAIITSVYDGNGKLMTSKEYCDVCNNEIARDFECPVKPRVELYNGVLTDKQIGYIRDYIKHKDAFCNNIAKLSELLFNTNVFYSENLVWPSNPTGFEFIFDVDGKYISYVWNSWDINDDYKDLYIQDKQKYIDFETEVETTFLKWLNNTDKWDPKTDTTGYELSWEEKNNKFEEFLTSSADRFNYIMQLVSSANINMYYHYHKKKDLELAFVPENIKKLFIKYNEYTLEKIYCIIMDMMHSEILASAVADAKENPEN